MRARHHARRARRGLSRLLHHAGRERPPRGFANGLARHPSRRRTPQRAGCVYHLHRLRIHLLARRQPAPQRLLSRQGSPAVAVQPLGFAEPRRSLGMDGRTSRQGHRRHRHSAQRQWLQRQHVRPREVRRRAVGRRLCGAAHAQRAASGDHSSKGHIRHSPVPLSERRVGGFRDLPLPNRQLGQESPAGQLCARGLVERLDDGGERRLQPLPLRHRRR